MTDMPDPRPIQVGADLHRCPDCGYRQGFHLAFVPEDDKLRIHLICPSCSARFDLGRCI